MGDAVVSRWWNDPTQKLQALRYGVLLPAFFALLAMGAVESRDAKRAQDDAGAAVVHAAVDGRAGPAYNSPDVATQLTAPLWSQNYTPATLGNASTAVTADQVRADYSMALAAETQEN